MPRPNKRIIPGPLERPIIAARSSNWNKHAGPEHADQYEPDGSSYIDAVSQETVLEVDLTNRDPVVSIGQPAAHIDTPPPVTLVWRSERTIEGRSYHRADAKVPEAADLPH